MKVAERAQKTRLPLRRYRKPSKTRGLRVRMLPFRCPTSFARLVGALGEKSHQNHQVGKGEKPLIGLDAGGFSSAGDESKVTGLGEIMDVFDANPRETGNFRIRENLLTRLDRDHGLAPLGPIYALTFLDAVSIVFVPV